MDIKFQVTPTLADTGVDVTSLAAAIQLVIIHAFVPEALRDNFVLFLPSVRDQQLLLFGTTAPPADLPAALRALAAKLEQHG